MLQCNSCGKAIDPEYGPQLEIGLRRTVRDRNGNEIIAEIKCLGCTDDVPGLSDQEAVGAGAS